MDRTRNGRARATGPVVTADACRNGAVQNRLLGDAATDGAGNRALRVVCVIDEAHRILGNRLPGLSGLIRLSRSKGGAVMLISQGPDDFSGEEDDVLNEMGLVVAFRTNADARAVRRILGPGANLAMLENGQAWVKVGGDAAARRVIAWRSSPGTSGSGASRV